MTKVVIDYAHKPPIVVQRDGRTEAFDTLNLTDKDGTTIAQFTVGADGLVAVQVHGGAYPANVRKRSGRQRKRREDGCGGCL